MEQSFTENQIRERNKFIRGAFEDGTKALRVFFPETFEVKFFELSKMNAQRIFYYIGKANITIVKEV